MNHPRPCIALVVAAGRGTRAGEGGPKQYRALAGEPVLKRAIRAFKSHPAVDQVCVVIGGDDREVYETATAGLDLLPPAIGGDTRQASVRLGLEALKDRAPANVLIHDAARPLVDAPTISAVTTALETFVGAIPVLPVPDTLKRTSDLTILNTVDREGLAAAQTPQGFRYLEILAAHHHAIDATLTDDAAVAQHAGLVVAAVPGSRQNFKLTTVEDFAMAEALLAARRQTRTGQGFDVHRFGPGDHVWLCGINVPHSHGLIGHSDADVGLHALTDAILGAIAKGDIGQHFPPSDERWRGAPSHVFLSHAADLVRDFGGRIESVDVTLICERPKVSPHREAMVARIAEILELDPSQVSVKATTTEGLGFTGRAEGIAAQAIATVSLP
ncbi:MAG: bifunctional 2-C-methyl-D-erythritol 4-phosphate cytidylyltransferase/2-C-methyl-D-erythritol 2,4-cyclodiphosphate synthase [Alphaproteobacteria bacterium]|nr:bifunctional 2-C-methyl-D-erythritol 4-phosphate cytidylyltransferase/2-C-methyl-D-erythritol 2,4-cyclodiphosphate synthase [Alphaproteobacteria bacterium]